MGQFQRRLRDVAQPTRGGARCREWTVRSTRWATKRMRSGEPDTIVFGAALGAASRGEALAVDRSGLLPRVTDSNGVDEAFDAIVDSFVPFTRSGTDA